ncbi:MAG: type II toxin-antitoxin system RelE/ParE family toxin [Armatimonadetes bacterium]|nr:type II toxin-antitoxin system RelE/ParE family toxin [Armatimonadota bacterium]
MTSDYEIVYYRDESGFSQIEEFIDDLPAKDRIRIFAYVYLLKEKGFLPFPYTSDIRGVRKLRELRIKVALKNYRILYFMFRGRKIVLLYSFLKKSNKIGKEIQTAELRMEDYLKKEVF